MALFFDNTWFDARLRDKAQDRDSLAAHLGLSRTEIDMAFKDQRELTGEEVAALAAFIDTPVDEVVNRAGIATPQPNASRDPIHILEKRITQLEKQVADLTEQLLGLPHKETKS